VERRSDRSRSCVEIIQLSAAYEPRRHQRHWPERSQCPYRAIQLGFSDMKRVRSDHYGCEEREAVQATRDADQ
jgi:hypothetical protein